MSAPSSYAVGVTIPCDATGPTVLSLARDLRLPRRVIEGMEQRAVVGRQKYGSELRASWPPASREALEEMIDAVGYLLASGDGDDATMAIRLAGQMDAWARKRGLYIDGPAK